MTTTTTASAAASRCVKPTVASHLHDYWGRVRGGDIGSLPAILGLIVLCLIFGIARPTFFSAVNFANLFSQGAAVIFIAMGLVFVLLLGEIDLSAGFASGVCGAVMAILLTNHGWHWYTAIPAALVTGLVIGFVLGFLVAKVGIPSFVVTLAAFLAFQGILLVLLSGGKNVSIRDTFVLSLANKNMSVVIELGARDRRDRRLRGGAVHPAPRPRRPRPGHRPDRHRARRGSAALAVLLLAAVAVLTRSAASTR